MHGMRAQCPAERHPVHAGHGPIGDHKGNRVLRYLGKGFGTASSQYNSIVLTFKKQLKRSEGVFVVVHKKDRRHDESPCLRECESGPGARDWTLV